MGGDALQAGGPLCLMNRFKADRFLHAFHRVTNMGQVIGWLEKT